MTARLLALVALMPPMLVACHGDHAPAAPAVLEATASAATLPADRQCLPLNVCDKWSGCALVAKGPKSWTVIAANRFASGDAVEVTNVCNTGDTCIGVRGVPKGVLCPATTAVPLIAPPGYRCVWDGKTCHRS